MDPGKRKPVSTSPSSASTGARWDQDESPSRSALLIEHDLFGRPLHTFPDHAVAYLSKASAAISSLIRNAALANESEHQQLAAANDVKSSSETGYCIAGRRSEPLAGSHGMNNGMAAFFASCRR
jgi:hypothetical protein